MHKDPSQYTNLAKATEYMSIVDRHQAELADKLQAIRDNDLGLN